MGKKTITIKLDDNDIRQALDGTVRTSATADTLIRHELGISAHTKRIDLATIGTDRFCGYEIKSDKDTLSRLQEQAVAYSKVLDFCYLVATPKHIDDAIKIIPEWWGVWLARGDDSGVTLNEMRAGYVNSCHDPFALAQMLWREEALDELLHRGLGKGLSRKARHYVWLELSTAVPVDEIRQIVRNRLRSRTSWGGGNIKGVAQSGEKYRQF